MHCHHKRRGYSLARVNSCLLQLQYPPFLLWAACVRPILSGAALLLHIRPCSSKRVRRAKANSNTKANEIPSTARPTVAGLGRRKADAGLNSAQAMQQRAGHVDVRHGR